MLSYLDIPDPTTPFDYISLVSAISRLPRTGKELVILILSSPPEIFDWTAPEITTKPQNLKLYLKEIGWTDYKIKKGFSSVKRMLHEIQL